MCANSLLAFVGCISYFFCFPIMQMEDGTHMLILEILCKIYQGEVWTWLLSYNICGFGRFCNRNSAVIIISVLSFICSFQFCRSHFVSSSGTEEVLLMVLSGVFFATQRVNFLSGLWSLFAFYHPFVKELGLLNVCEYSYLAWLFLFGFGMFFKQNELQTLSLYGCWVNFNLVLAQSSGLACLFFVFSYIINSNPTHDKYDLIWSSVKHRHT